MFLRRSWLAACFVVPALAVFGCTLDKVEDELTENTPLGDDDTQTTTDEATWDKARDFLNTIESADYQASWFPMFEESSEPRPMLNRHRSTRGA